MNSVYFQFGLPEFRVTNAHFDCLTLLMVELNFKIFVILILTRNYYYLYNNENIKKKRKLKY